METKYNNNSAVVYPDTPANLDKLVDLSQVNRCPHCSQIWSKGILLPGTALEIICKRCKLRIIEIVPSE